MADVEGAKLKISAAKADLSAANTKLDEATALLTTTTTTTTTAPATTSVGTDQAPSINQALATGHVDLRSGADIITISTAIVVPTDRNIEGGRGRTVIKANDDFSGGFQNSYNGGICSAIGAKRLRILNLAVDMRKVGLAALLAGDQTKRLNAVKIMQADGFLVENVDASDFSGYGGYSQGSFGATPVYCRNGVWRNFRTKNGNVHIEQTCGEDIDVDGFYCSDGDGDIPCEAYLHPLEASRRIRIRRGLVDGRKSATANGILLATAAATYGLSDISFEDVDIICGGMGIAGGGADEARRDKGFLFRNCGFRSRLNYGANVSFLDARVHGGRFEGKKMGFQSVFANLDVTDCDALGVTTAADDHAFGISGDALLKWDGGTIEARASGLNAQKYPVGGQGPGNNPVVTSRTRLVSA